MDKKTPYTPPQLFLQGSVQELTGYETIAGSEDDYYDASGTIIGSGGGSQDGCVFKQGVPICQYTDVP